MAKVELHRAISRAATSVAALVMYAFLTSFTVVIDAGHGGHDTGCVGQAGREKDINLAVATRVGNLLKSEMDDVEIVYTRDTDRFVTLQGRCDIANRARGDIFVSIHTNSVDERSPNRNSVSGASVYTLGLRRSDTNLEVAMRENSVMKLEDDYTTTYSGFDPSSAESYIIFEMSQSAHRDQSIRLADEIQRELCATAHRRDMGVRQEPFWVLVRTSMPAVLVELDFICNPQVEEYLLSDAGRDQLARAIANGVKSYRQTAGGTTSHQVSGRSGRRHARQRQNSNAAQTASQAQQAAQAQQAVQEQTAEARTEQSEVTEQSSPGQIFYRIQFMTSPRVLSPTDSRLTGLGDDVDHYTDGGTVKYVVGNYKSLEAANRRLQSVKQRYSDAFIIIFRDGQRVR